MGGTVSKWSWRRLTPGPAANPYLDMTAGSSQISGPGPFIRHSRLTRLFHWLNFVVITIMLMSGLNIFNARPDLYWGNISHFHHPLLALGAVQNRQGDILGITKIGGHAFVTTGVLGASAGSDGELVARGFPRWATLPSASWLAMARRWHFFFAWIFVANGVAYAFYSLIGGHLRRDLWPGLPELRQTGRSIWEHVHLRFPRGREARSYNILQKLAYLFVVFGLGPLIVLTGLTMSPTIDAGFPFLLTLFGGRQTARTIHFLCAFSFLGFFLVHIVMVIVSGFWNNVRSMVTGRYVVLEDKDTAPVEEPALGAATRTEELSSDCPGLERRGFLISAAGSVGIAAFGGASIALLTHLDALSENQRFVGILDSEGHFSEEVQSRLVSPQALAPEYTKADISPFFRVTGTSNPGTSAYAQIANSHFQNWHLRIEGLVARPASWSLDELRAMPQRTQITRHDCVEGWSCIGEWRGVPLSHLLALAKPMAAARFVVFWCADSLDGVNPYYESLNLTQANHPQTILAYDMNGTPLPIAHGAPLRLRVEQQLGYKMAKYVMRIQLVRDYRHLGAGHGGYWEDQGYAWYAGI